MKRILIFALTLLLTLSLSGQGYMVDAKYIDLAGVSSTVNINAASDVSTYFIQGTKTLSSSLTVAVTGTPYEGKAITLFWDASMLTTGSYPVSVLGVSLTTSPSGFVRGAKLIFFSVYVHGGWTTWYIPNADNTHWITKTDIASTTVDNSTISVDDTYGIRVKPGGITSNEVSTTAGIPYSALSLTGKLSASDFGTKTKVPYSALDSLPINKALISSSSGRPTYSSVTSTELGYVSGVTSALQTQLNARPVSGAITEADLSVATAIPYSYVNLSNHILNADIATGANIAVSKLAAGTPSKIAITDGSGVWSTSDVSSSKLTMLANVTSDIQAQLTAISNAAASLTRSIGPTITLTGSATKTYILNATSNDIIVTLPSSTDATTNQIVDITKQFSSGSYSAKIYPGSGTTITDKVGGNPIYYEITGVSGSGVEFIYSSGSWSILKTW